MVLLIPQMVVSMFSLLSICFFFWLIFVLNSLFYYYYYYSPPPFVVCVYPVGFCFNPFVLCLIKMREYKWGIYSVTVLPVICYSRGVKREFTGHIDQMVGKQEMCTAFWQKTCKAATNLLGHFWMGSPESMWWKCELDKE